MLLNFPRRQPPVLLVLLTLACLLPSSALADGGKSIAAAPGIVYGQQQFGNTATGSFEPRGCCACPLYNSYWLATVVAGDRLTVNWEGQSGTTLAVYPVHTTDFTVANTESSEVQSLSSNGKNQLVFTAGASGVMPVLFDACDIGVGPYDFTAFVRHVVRLALPHFSKLQRTGTLRVAAHTAEGGSITDAGLLVDVQLRTRRKWLIVGTASVASSVAAVPLRIPVRFAGQEVRLRAVAHGAAYLSAAIRSRTALLVEPPKRDKHSRTSSAVLASAISTRIVVGQGMAGVKLGDSQARVTQVLGAPDSTDNGWDYLKGLQGRVTFDAKGHVRGIWTGSKKQKTKKGIGTGSSLARVKAAYPKIKCSTGPFGPQSLVCVLKSRFHGRNVETSFPFFTRALGVREVDVDLV